MQLVRISDEIKIFRWSLIINGGGGRVNFLMEAARWFIRDHRSAAIVYYRASRFQNGARCIWREEVRHPLSPPLYPLELLVYEVQK